LSRDKIKTFLNEHKNESMLEIGPLVNPFMSRDCYSNVYYADIKSKDEIYEEYKNSVIGSINQLYDEIIPIDYVVTETYKDAVGDMEFSVVFSSHVIEHVSDVIGHLIELSEILTDNGFVALIIPDKRYCFDNYREVTPFRDMFDVYKSIDTKSLARFAFDHGFKGTLYYTPEKYWNNEITEPIYDEEKYRRALECYNKMKAEGETNALTHWWVFTYASFIEFLGDCLKMNLLPYTLHYSSPPEPGSNEFTIILMKDKSLLTDLDKRKREIQKIAKLLEDESPMQNQVAYSDYKKMLLQNEELLHRNQLIESQYISLVNSTSWKVTKPIRAIGDRLKRVITQPMHPANIEDSSINSALPGNGIREEVISMGEKNEQYLECAPSIQNVVDIFKGKWHGKLPIDGVQSGEADIYRPGTDARIIQWSKALQFEGKKVLELGPSEGSVMYQLSEMGVASLTSIEANRDNYLKCLIVKDLLKINVDLLFGDFREYMKVCNDRFDIVVASGVLYHMTDPVSLINDLAEVSDNAFIWTCYYLDGRKDIPIEFEEEPVAIGRFFGHKQCYGAIDGSVFLGGSRPYSVWMKRDDIISALRDAGFNNITVLNDDTDYQGGANINLFVSK